MRSPAITRNTIYRSTFRNQILKLLSKINKGHLMLSLPEGNSVSFGDESQKEIRININNESFFDKCFLYGDIGFGEAYVDGDWDTEDLCGVVSLLITNLENIPGISGSKTKSFLFNIFRSYNRLLHAFRANSISGSRKNITFHYDLSNEFFRTFLDETMTYSSAYYPTGDLSLEEAQLEKYKRIWNNLSLNQNDHVLEIGCGWGFNAVEMARRFGCKVTAITISDEQFRIASKRVKDEKLEHLISIELIDYRNVQGSFSKIISIEMLEAVGHKYLPLYFEKIASLLKPEGLLALQVITCPDSRYDQLRQGTDWIQKHIFPGTLLPSVGVINNSVAAKTKMSLVDLKDIGFDYAKTLNIWKQRFSEKEIEIKNLGFDETFIRKWNYYFSYCEAAFAMRNINCMQMVYAGPNNLVYK